MLLCQYGLKEKCDHGVIQNAVQNEDENRSNGREKQKQK